MLPMRLLLLRLLRPPSTVCLHHVCHKVPASYCYRLDKMCGMWMHVLPESAGRMDQRVGSQPAAPTSTDSMIAIVSIDIPSSAACIFRRLGERTCSAAGAVGAGNAALASRSSDSELVVDRAGSWSSEYSRRRCSRSPTSSRSFALSAGLSPPAFSSASTSAAAFRHPTARGPAPSGSRARLRARQLCGRRAAPSA
eukprot:SAG31_NODE_3693_length_3983_cov_2.012358_4_plen_196_part_00